jgi:hypothetical protein
VDDGGSAANDTRKEKEWAITFGHSFSGGDTMSGLKFAGYRVVLSFYGKEH